MVFARADTRSEISQIRRFVSASQFHEQTNIDGVAELRSGENSPYNAIVNSAYVR